MKVVSINEFYRELKKYYRHPEMGLIDKGVIHQIFEKIKFDVEKNGETSNEER